MKVLFFIDGSKKGYGSEKVAVDVIDNLSQRGVEFIVITTVSGFVREYCIKNNIETHLLSFYSYMYRSSKIKVIEYLKRLLQIIYGFTLDAVCIFKLKKMIDLSEIDLIYTNHSKNFIGGIISRRYKIPHIIHLHELFNGHYYVYPLLPNQSDWLNKHTDIFISCAKLVAKNWVNAGIDNHKIINIYNGIDYRTIPVKNTVSNDILKIVMVASVSKQKGQLLVLKALMNISNEKRKNIVIDFYGGSEDDESSKVEEYINKNSIRARLIGYDENVKEKLQSYDIGINCSRAEACSISILEYKAAGLAVVASDAGGTKEIIKHNYDGMLFNRKNLNELSNIIEFLYDNREDISRLGQNARSNVEEKFGIDTFYDKVYDVFKKSIV